MRVAVLGAGGTIAPAIVRDLADSEEIAAMRLIDVNGAKAAATAEAHGGGKAEAIELDAAAGGALARELESCGALINSASYRLNLDAMRACLEAGCHYLDLGGLYWMAARQLELSPEFEAAGLLAVLGIGSSPGKTNLMAARAVAELGGEADSLHVCAGGRDLDPPPGESFPYALRTLLDEVTMAPVAIRDGEPVELDPLAPGGEVDFGDPIGIAPTVNTIHSEMLTFASSFGCREASFRLSLPPAVEARLRELAGADDEETARAGSAASPPSSETVSIHLVDATRWGRSVRVRSLTPPHRDWGLGGGIVSTATPIAAASRLLARGEVDARGALPPELCLEPAAMFAELETRGVRFEVEATQEAGI
ncbi:MAG: saccharopine dehydrogenase NADP-binding domain-containing protein [Solirubrobacterales bacterium]|nr:saccharopine dehydrogenase NADP-binding domain-containing protein [Solirubrobacterales bacterium]